MSYCAPYCEKSCQNCRWREYDTTFDEQWCGHKPPPEGVGPRLEIDSNGCCEYFSSDKWSNTEVKP